ncbi:hypothetical protein JTB14_025497 [Gonioctena quinquepunctata]|nr:hypothetical protein JTB14_025497 [Gonioctena quinquepunctata]
MRDHLKRKHPQESHNDNEEPEAGTSVLACDNGSIKKRKSMRDYINRENYYLEGSQKKKMPDKLYVKMIAEDLEPFRKGVHPGFQAFVKALDEYYNDIKEKLQEAVNKAKYISLTTDMWTSIATEGILAITCHFVHEGKLIAPLLSTVKVEGHHTTNIIANVGNIFRQIKMVIDEILIAWNIRHKVVAIVTDNAQNMINVAEILKIRHLPCFAHTLNLAVQDSFKIPGFEIIISKCKKVVTFFRSSTLAADTLRLIQTQNNKKTLKLIQEVNTRWNSLFYMLERLQLVKNELAVAINECPKAPPLLTAEEYEVIKETITILKPFEVATELISGEQYITSSLIIPLIRGISTKLATLEGSINTEVGLQVIESLKSSMLKRFTPYERRTPTIIATIRNPKYKKRGFKTDGDAVVAMELLQKEYTSFLNSHTPTPVPVETVDATSKDPKENKQN